MSFTELSKLSTLPNLLAKRASLSPEGVAFREKRHGIWRAYTWAECQERVTQLTLGLHHLGVTSNQVIAIYSRNCVDWALTEIAVHANSAISAGIDSDASVEDAKEILQRTQAHTVLVDGQEQIDLLLEHSAQLPSIKHIIYLNARGLSKYSDERLISIDQIREQGRESALHRPIAYEALRNKGRSGDVVAICPTPGSTGSVKLPMFTSEALIQHSLNCTSGVGLDDSDEYVSTHSLAHVSEQVNVVAACLLRGMKINFTESHGTAASDFREIGPTIVRRSASEWEEVVSQVRLRLEESGPITRKIYEHALNIATDAQANGKKSWVAEALIARPLRDRLGLTNVRYATTSEAHIDNDSLSYLRAVGVPLVQSYVIAEVGGPITSSGAGHSGFGDLGVPFRNIQIEISGADADGVGEIYITHPSIFSGYYRDAAATHAVMRDQWFRTGDMGYLDERDHLILIDRSRDYLIVDAKKVSPQLYEKRLQRSSYIKQAFVFQDSESQICSILSLNFSALSRWAEKKRLKFKTYADLVSQQSVVELIKGEIASANLHQIESQKVRQFVIAERELHMTEGTLTSSGKMRRVKIERSFPEIFGVSRQRVTGPTPLTEDSVSALKIRE